MPIIASKFEPQNYLLQNAHVSTIYASLLRQIPTPDFQRERIDTPDGDFLDLDWIKNGNRQAIIVLPGLEGKSRSRYTKASVRYFTRRGWDALAMNYRGCSGEPNRLLRGYHMGATDDVSTVVNHAIREHGYTTIVLLGFSLGGNLALKYVGEKAATLPSEVKATVNFSAPMDLQKSDERLNEWYNWHYLKWFMFPLNRKANQKKRQFPGQLQSYRGCFMSGNFIYFDTHFNAPANGYDSVEAYWADSTCLPYLKHISVPSLVVSAVNDTFISANCYPYEAAKQNPNLFLEMPLFGGHCGFIRHFSEQEWWMEERAYEFVQQSYAPIKIADKNTTLENQTKT